MKNLISGKGERTLLIRRFDYQESSLLQFLEWRWGLAIENENAYNLTQVFENSIKKALFKNLPKKRHRQTHSSQTIWKSIATKFNQILDETKLQRIRNEQKLIPWAEYHTDFIKAAQQRHEEIGIIESQKELCGAIQNHWRTQIHQSENKKHRQHKLLSLEN